jgi:addiction module RelE/StbE family toxin
VADRAVAWTQAAKHDLAAIVDFIAASNPVAAIDVLDKLEARAEAPKTQAVRGRIVPELRDAGILEHRELIVKPWRILYLVEGEEVHVTAVLDARRDLQTLLLERLARS